MERFEADEDAYARFEGGGALLDGEIVLAKVRGEEEYLAKLGADAEVGGEDLVFSTDGVVIRGTGLGVEALSTSGGGAEGEDSGSG